MVDQTVLAGAIAWLQAQRHDNVDPLPPPPAVEPPGGDSSDYTLAWCGGSVFQPVILHYSLSPCYFETVAGPLALLVLLFTLLIQRRRLALITHLMKSGPTSKGTTAVEGLFIGGPLFFIAMHLLHLILCLAVPSIRTFLFHAFWHACGALSWTICTALHFRASRVHVALDLRPFTITMSAMLVNQIYSFFQLYGIEGTYPDAYYRGNTWTVLLQTMLAVGLVIVDFKRGSAGAFTSRDSADGYLPLAPSDTEAGLQPGPSKRAGSTPAPREEEQRTWISMFWDTCAYVWPENWMLQARAMCCLTLLGLVRVLNIAVPILYKHLIDLLAAASAPSTSAPLLAPATGSSSSSSSGLQALAALCADVAKKYTFMELLYPWTLLYLAAIFFQGGMGGAFMGILNQLRSYLWIPVAQDAYRRISMRVFSHIMDLDLNFHLHKKTGEVTKMVDRGTDAMQNILSTILFSITPQLVDVLIGSTYLAQALEPTIAIIMFVTVGCYMPITVIITEWRSKLRRELNRTDQACAAKVTDTLMNYETVKYFNNDAYESKQYAKAIQEYQRAEYLTSVSMNGLNIVQSLIMFLGVSSGLLVCLAAVQRGTMTVGDTVLYMAMMSQLYQPLAFFGSNYRVIQTYMIDMENLLNLLEKRPKVVDSPGAKPLKVTGGEIVFDNVTFGYTPDAIVLKDVSLSCPGGRTIAFVGATGSGKSTVTRLLFRFYDVSSGCVRIDGQDLRDVTQASLRSTIGMVPQDTVLFNDTILNNIRYGDTSASDEQVYEVAKAACIHDSIVQRFPKGYETMVGERGLRLSGGEKQRVAVARAILKNPQILILDEATSALDSITEKKIQEAMHTVRQDRTTVIVAHRLSTISDADVIVVMKLGMVAEMGRHSELLQKQGLYAEMWAKQQAAPQQEEEEGGNGIKQIASVVDLQQQE